MILRRIQVQNFRKFRAPTALLDIPDGLVIVAGDNEEGKSTLLSALRAAFFAKHSWNGQLVDSYAPYGWDVTPEVHVDFELDGLRYSVEKRFRAKKSCKLSGGGRMWEGDAAEAELARLLGADAPKRAPRDGDDETGNEGPLGLLWVRQGGAWSPAASGTASEGLRGLLEHEVGEMLGGPRAQAIAEKATARRSELLTPTGKTTGELRAAAERREELCKDEKELKTRLAAHDAARESLSRDKARLAGLESQLPEYRQRRRDAVDGAEDAKQLTQRLQRLTAQRTAAEQTSQRIAEQINQRGKTRAEITRVEALIQERQAVRGQAQAVLEGAEAACKTAAQRALDSAQKLSEAEARLGRMESHIELNREHSFLAELEARLAGARQAQTRRAALLAESRALPDAKALAELRKKWDALQRAQAVFEAAGTRVSVELFGSVSAMLDGRPVSGSGSETITQGAILDITAAGDRLARIRIQPSTPADHEKRRDLCRAEWGQAAAPFGIDNVAEAHVRSERRARAEAEAVMAQQDVARVAPNGIEQLEFDVEAKRQNVKRLRDAGSEFDAEPAASLEAARNEVEACRKAHGDAARVGAVAVNDLGNAQQRLGTAQDELRRDENDLQARQGALAAEAAATPEEELTAERSTAERNRAELAKQIEPIDTELKRLDPQRLESNREMACRALERLEGDIQQTSHQVERGKGMLASSEPWAEQMDAVTSELEFAEERLAELERRARALRLLSEALDRARSESEARFLGPVLARVEPLAQRLLPGAKLVLDTGMALRGLRRGPAGQPQEEEFNSLSLGTREQLAILVRLAFAQLLREKGRPAITILDDAPAYADPVRFAEMLRILHECARDTQILVLTCREHEFRPSGAHILHLAAASAADAAAAR
ncbi:MAG TPA: AAA family ATPase [Terriglobales bacterium]|nr:AAA family ATPase [Terriglobales bacterium]